MKKQLIRMTESDLHQIIESAANQVLNEISWQKSDDAAYAAEYEGPNWDHIKGLAEDLMYELESAQINNEYSDSTQFVSQIIPMMQKVVDFATRKADQVENLDSLNQDNFANQHNGVNKRDYEQGISDKYNQYWNGHDNSDEGFEDTLDDKEREYYNEKM